MDYLKDMWELKAEAQEQQEQEHRKAVLVKLVLLEFPLFLLCLGFCIWLGNTFVEPYMCKSTNNFFPICDRIKYA